MDSRKDLLFAVAMVCLGVAVILVTANFREPVVQDTIGPRAFPYGLGLLFAVGGAFVAIQRLKSMHAGNGYIVPDEGGEDEEAYPASGVRAMAMIALCCVYTVVLQPIGFIVATPFFVALALFLMNERKPVLLVTTSLCFTAGTYVLIHLLLDGRLPEGVLKGLLP